MVTVKRLGALTVSPMDANSFLASGIPLVAFFHYLSITFTVFSAPRHYKTRSWIIHGSKLTIQSI
ncbi:hypothetical protein GF326_01705 [Candidatus Bathyarchaeota archaeon]|nr:hypothetical protein [Candidatus Bathyarchaeota archaeon]